MKACDMYIKLLKQKLFKKHPWIRTVSVAVVFSTFSILFILAAPAVSYLGQNSKVAAQSADQRAKAWCGDPKNRIVDKEACKKGYIGGFNGNPDNTAACGSGDGRGADRDYADCGKGYLAGKEARGAPSSGKPENSDALTSACLAYKGDNRTACNDGYEAGYAGQSLNICFSGDRTRQEACRTGYSAGQAKKSGDQASDQERNEAREACKDGKNQLAKDACATGYLAAKNGLSKEEACNGARDQRACKTGYDRGKGKDPGGNQIADCDTKLLNPLSWIICPIIDLGAGLSDTVFQDIVKPLLSDVPVSTNRNDPIYQVWQGFRLIANVMLVGAMLAIVYAQAKGGDK